MQKSKTRPNLTWASLRPVFTLKFLSSIFCFPKERPLGGFGWERWLLS